MPAISFSDSASSADEAGLPPAAQQIVRSNAAAAAATSRPLKRVARFLGDEGSDDDPAGGYADAHTHKMGKEQQQKKRTTAQDVDLMFADLDDEDEDGLPPPLASKQRKNASKSASQMNNIDDKIGYGSAGEDGDVPNDKLDADAKAKKPRRKLILMNEERLLGDKGIRRLKENLKGFKIKGKGHEEDDLRRLMSVYQLWAHQMFPAGSFRDTITSVERLCKAKRMKRMMYDWRDEASGKLPPPLSARRDDEDVDLTTPSDGDFNNGDHDNEDEQQQLRATTSQAGSPERVAPKKSYFDDIPTSSPGGALSRDPEMALDEDELAESLFGGTAPSASLAVAGPSRVAAAVRKEPAPARMPTSEAGFNDADLQFDLDEDDFDMDAEAEAAMREMEAMQADEDEAAFFAPGPGTSRLAAGKAVARASTVAPPPVSNPAISFYAEPKAGEKSKNRATVAEKSLKSQSSPVRHKSGDNLEDDFDFGDEEDILREMEMEEERQAAAAEEKQKKERAAEQVVPAAAGSAKEGESTAASVAMNSMLDEEEEEDLYS